MGVDYTDAYYPDFIDRLKRRPVGPATVPTAVLLASQMRRGMWVRAFALQEGERIGAEFREVVADASPSTGDVPTVQVEVVEETIPEEVQY